MPAVSWTPGTLAALWPGVAHEAASGAADGPPVGAPPAIAAPMDQLCAPPPGGVVLKAAQGELPAGAFAAWDRPLPELPQTPEDALVSEGTEEVGDMDGLDAKCPCDIIQSDVRSAKPVACGCASTAAAAAW